LNSTQIISTIATIVAFNVHAIPPYFAKYQNIADSLETKYGIPSALMLSIGFIESAAGKSKVALLLNNHFGIVGSNNLMQTHQIYSRYRYFASDTAAYEGFCKLVASKKFYAKLKGTDNISNWAYALHAVGYASAPTWPAKIIRICKTYQLT
jgi:flagellum-specific peptidoglycan hydrolase FlgJ